ncbi:hypothetical protein K3495_g4554 [Podosphaera aphanis]|nr:hypothetical protein K3495_g4554 [Podosphaera aphanis]
MPRQTRSSGGGRAPSRPTLPSKRSVAPSQQQTRPATTVAQPPTAMAAPPQASAGSSVLGQVASTAAGVAAGSIIGNAIGGLFGGSSQPATEAPQNDKVAAQSSQDQQNNWGARSCEVDAKQFTKCMEEHQGNMQVCNWYLEQLKACQQASTSLEQLQIHLKIVLESLDTPLVAKLFDEVELLITEENSKFVIPKLLPLLTQILPKYPRDPTLLASLSTKLLSSLPFSQILSVASEENLILALQSPFPSAALLGVTILSRAVAAPSHVAILSTMKPVVSALIRTWLSTPDTGLGEAATKLLGDLLETDYNHSKYLSEDGYGLNSSETAVKTSAGGQGLLWRRIFQDQDIYELIFSLCSSKITALEDNQLDEHQKTLAQARLLALLPRLGVLDFQTISQSHFPEIERKYASRSLGLLSFATEEMIDKDQDLLMHIILVNFFGEFLNSMSMTRISPQNFASLEQLLKKLASEDASLRKSLKITAADPETTPELKVLLTRLKECYND